MASQITELARTGNMARGCGGFSGDVGSRCVGPEDCSVERYACQTVRQVRLRDPMMLAGRIIAASPISTGYGDNERRSVAMLVDCIMSLTLGLTTYAGMSVTTRWNTAYLATAMPSTANGSQG
jgi:hypothetical protein